MKLIIGMCGEARVGKDSIAGMLAQEHGFTHTSFADPLKRACMEIFGFSWDQVYGDLKEMADDYWGFTPRWALQFVGTNLFRNWKQDIWLKTLEKKIVSHPEVDRWVISDCRFLNEKNFLESLGGEVWRIIRTDGVGASGGLKGHPSEEELKKIPLQDFPVVIEKPTGVEGLLTEARTIFNNRHV